MGHIRVTKAGYLYFDFFYRNRRCREYTELKHTPANARIMEEAMKKIDSEMQLGTFSYEKYFVGSKNAEKMSGDDVGEKGEYFKAYAEKWFRNSRIQWKPSVRRDFYSTLHKHLLPYFGEKAIEEITKPLLKEFRTALSELKGRKGSLSNKRINNIMSVLRLILNEASEEFDLSSPFVNLKPLSVKKSEIMPFSLEEVFLFLNTVPKTFYAYYVVRFFSGMRTAEVDGLKWQYVDFINRKILVRETWQNRQWVSPKTESSVRDIDMSKMLEEALLEQRNTTGDKEFVFCNAKGQPHDYNNISKRIWYPTLTKAGLSSRTPYQTRHTAATLWLASGENPEWVAKQLGHANAEMLFRIYSKFVPNLTRRDGSAFERFLDERKEALVSQDREDNACRCDNVDTSDIQNAVPS